MLVALAHSGNYKSIQIALSVGFGGYWHMVLFWGIIAALPALIHARLHGCAGSSRPERNRSANPNCMLIVNHI